jgi:hypothetical protein
MPVQRWIYPVDRQRAAESAGESTGDLPEPEPATGLGRLGKSKED